MKAGTLACAVVLHTCLLFWCSKFERATSAAVVSATSQHSVHKLDDKGGSATTQSKHRTGQKKPHLPGTNTSSEVFTDSDSGVKRKTLVLQARPQSSASHSEASLSRSENCSPQVMRITLQHPLGCSKRVPVSMCYGQCQSFSYPSKEHLTYATRRSGDVHSACRCCSPTRIEKVVHKMKCRMGHRVSTKIFHVPTMKDCSCRPCSAH